VLLAQQLVQEQELPTRWMGHSELTAGFAMEQSDDCMKGVTAVPQHLISAELMAPLGSAAYVSPQLSYGTASGCAQLSHTTAWTQLIVSLCTHRLYVCRSVTPPPAVICFRLLVIRSLVPHVYKPTCFSTSPEFRNQLCFPLSFESLSFQPSSVNLAA
jgi:hypothetical protein